MNKKDLVYLTQTDTTIGFVSQNKQRLDHIKQRPSHKHYITAVNSLTTLQSFIRVPNAHKNRLRRSQKTTFIFPNKRSFRVIKEAKHLELLHTLQWAYTTSANLSNQHYDENFARKNADKVIEPLHHSQEASKIYKINHFKIKRIR